MLLLLIARGSKIISSYIPDRIPDKSQIKAKEY